MNRTTTITPAQRWTDRYEALRQHVLAGNQLLGSPPLGLVVVCRQGLATWMRQWAQLETPPLRSSPPPVAPALMGIRFLHHELSGLLAEMTAGHFLNRIHS